MPDTTQSPLSADERALIRAAQKGDLEAFSTVVRSHYQAVHAFLVVRLPNLQDAEDLTQDAFLTAFRQLSEFNCERPLAPWLRGIALNLLRNHRRKFRPDSIGGNEDLQLLIETQIETTLAVGNEATRLTAMRECLDQIEGPSRALLLSHYSDGETLREIAAKAGRGYSAVAMQVHRLRELLASCVSERVTSTP